MIAAIEWVPAGVADENPKKYEMNAAEKEVIRMLQEQEAAAAESDKQEATPKSSEEKAASVASKLQTTSKEQQEMMDNLPADLRMDEYSDDEDNGEALGNLLVGTADEEAEDQDDDDEENNDDDDENNDDDDDDMAEDGEDPADKIKTRSANNDNNSDDSEDDDDDALEDVPDTREYDPIDVQGLENMGFGDGMLAGDLPDDDDSEADDVKISPDDAMCVVAKTEEDFASLEVHVYDTKSGNLYIHHDIPLPAFPLCLAQGQMSSDEAGGGGNFCAVGTFEPGIEIWNLDVLNALEPSCVLGGEDTTYVDEVMKENLLRSSSGEKPRKPSRGDDGAQLRPGSHTGAVMGLSWNKIHRHVIASGSADHTVKIWDVSHASSGDASKAIAGTFKHHKDKVQSVVWHPVEATILATGSYDGTVALLDARDSAGQNIKKVKIPSDCEALAWDPFHPQYLTAACEDGTITTWDVRNFSDKSPLWSFPANEYGGLTDLSYNCHVPGMMATSFIDKTVALWDTYSQNDSPQVGAIPRACGSKDMKVGKLLTVSFYPSSPWLLGCGGSENLLALWDMSSEDAFQKRFASRLSSDVAADEEVPMKKETDFEAVMAAEDKVEAESNSSKKKKRKKKKVARRGR